MKKYFFALTLILILFSLNASINGKHGFQILKISSGTDATALAETGAIEANNAFGFMQNPASGLFQKTKTISTANNYWIFGTSLNSTAYLNSNGKSAFACGYRFLDYGKLINYDDTAQPDGEFHPLDFILSFNFARRISPDHFIGTTLNTLFEKIDSESSFGYSFDFGYIYLPPIQNLAITTALKNVGFTTKMENEGITLPLSGELSINYTFQTTKTITLTPEIKLIKNIDEVTRVNVGMNANLQNLLALKVGYKFNHETQSISGGIDIHLRKITVGYAFLPFKPEIDDVHMFELSYKF